jgi:hypothetical protein
MLRTELIRIEGEKLDSVEFDMSSVSLRHVTAIIAVLAEGLLAAILIGTVTSAGTTLRMTWHRDANTKQEI